MREIQTPKVTWIDFENPTPEDITVLREDFNIHPLAIEEFITPTFRPKATVYENCLFLTVHIPLYDTAARTTYAGEVDIILTKTHLITGHRTEIFQLTQLFDSLQNSPGQQLLQMRDTPAHLLYLLLETLLESCFPRLDNIARKIDAVEEQVFNGSERKMVREISFVKRDILNFRRTLMPQRSVLESLAQMKSAYIPRSLTPYFQDLVGTNIRIWNTLASSKETIESMEDTNESLLSDKLNQKMRVLTVFSALLIPMTLYANVFGMNVSIPENIGDFRLHLAIMFFLSLGTFLFFKWRNWI